MARCKLRKLKIQNHRPKISRLPRKVQNRTRRDCLAARKAVRVERRAISKILRQVNNANRKKTKITVTLNDLDSFAKMCRAFSREAAKQQTPLLQSYIQIIDLEIAAIGALAVATTSFQSRTNQVLHATFPAKDIHLSMSLTNITNTVLAILKLVVNGFDTQARALVRMLDERIYQSTLLYSAPQDFELWHEAQSDE